MTRESSALARIVPRRLRRLPPRKPQKWPPLLASRARRAAPIGLRVIESAYEEKTRHLDHEMCAIIFFLPKCNHAHIRLSLSQNIHRQQLRAYTKQQQNQIAALERRVAELEQAARDADERTRQMADEKARVENELKTTQRDLSKLDSFKRSILQSIQDEELPGAGLGGLSAAAGR